MIRMTGDRRIDLSGYARNSWTPEDTARAFAVLAPGERMSVVGKFPRGPWRVTTTDRREGRGATFAQAIARLTKETA